MHRSVFPGIKFNGDKNLFYGRNRMNNGVMQNLFAYFL